MGDFKTFARVKDPDEVSSKVSVCSFVKSKFMRALYRQVCVSNARHLIQCFPISSLRNLFPLPNPLLEVIKHQDNMCQSFVETFLCQHTERRPLAIRRCNKSLRDGFPPSQCQAHFQVPWKRERNCDTCQTLVEYRKAVIDKYTDPNYWRVHR